MVEDVTKPVPPAIESADEWVTKGKVKSLELDSSNGVSRGIT